MRAQNLHFFHSCALTAVVIFGGTTLPLIAGDGTAPGKHKPAGANANADAPKLGVEFILEHAQDLSLDADQKTKLTELNTKIEAQKDKLKQDPEIRELFRDAKEAKDSGDETAMHAARKRLREAMEKKSGLKIEDMMQDVAKILHPDQLQKLAELRKKADMDPNPGKTLKDQKSEEKADVASQQQPDRSKGTPNLYDDK